MTQQPRITLGTLPVDVLTFEGALDAIAQRVRARTGGAVFTPNVDHVVTAQTNVAFREAYAAASLSLVDGKPLLWAARALGTPLPAKISGSDLVWPLLQRAAQEGWRVFLLGGADGVAHAAASRMREELDVQVCGIEVPMIPADGAPADLDVLAAKIKDSGADLVLVALGAPKQELFIHRIRAVCPQAVFLGIGAALDFVIGRVRRAPRWMSEAGLEWAFRLAQEPGRLWRRYLVRDPAFALIVYRMLRERSAPAAGYAATLPPKEPSSVVRLGA